MNRICTWLLPVLLCCSCNDVKKNLISERKNIICLIDMSGSIQKKKISDFADGIKIILRSMAPEDKLVVYPIDGGALTDRVAIMYEDFKNANKVYGTTFKNLNLPDSVSPPFKKVGEDDFTAANKLPMRLDRYLETIFPMIKKRLDSIKVDRAKYEDKTDIVSALYSVKDDVEKSNDESWMPGTKKVKNFVIIFSDMVQDSELLTFERNEGIEPRDYDKSIGLLRENGLLPNLQHAQVIICDNFSDTKRLKSSRGKKHIRDFWERYFSDTSVNIVAQGVRYQNTGNMDGIAAILMDQQ